MRKQGFPKHLSPREICVSITEPKSPHSSTRLQECVPPPRTPAPVRPSPPSLQGRPCFWGKWREIRPSRRPARLLRSAVSGGVPASAVLRAQHCMLCRMVPTGQTASLLVWDTIWACYSAPPSGLKSFAGPTVPSSNNSFRGPALGHIAGGLDQTY